jgi:hypothetical protein
LGIVWLAMGSLRSTSVADCPADHDAADGGAKVREDQQAVLPPTVSAPARHLARNTSTGRGIARFARW